MAQTSTGKFLADTPQWAKGIVVVATLGAAYLVYRGIKKKSDEEKGVKKSTSSELPPSISADIKAQAKITPLSYPLSTYDGYANQLYGAMYTTGTDEDTIYKVIGYMKNDADVLQLIKAFGVRKGGWGQTFLGDGTLGEWFADELDTTEIGIVNKILASKKNPSIKYRF